MLRRESGFWLMLLGNLSSGLSLISLCQRIWNVGLIPVFADLVSYYRKIAYPIPDFLLQWAIGPVPDWYKDCFVLSVVGTAILLRTRDQAKGSPLPRWQQLRDWTVGLLLLSLTLVGLVIFVLIPVTAFTMKAVNEEEKLNARALQKTWLIVVAVVIFFFATNAFA